MSTWTRLSGEAGNSRTAALGGLAGLALIGAAIFGWMTMAPKPGELGEAELPQAQAPTAPAPETQTQAAVPSAAPVAEAPQPPEAPSEPAGTTRVDTEAGEGTGTPAMADAEPAAEVTQGQQDAAAETTPETQDPATGSDTETAEAAAPQPAVAQAAPEPPVTPLGGAAPVFELVRVEESGDAVIAGRAQAGGKVRILLDGVEVAQAPADATGAFVALVSLDPSGDARTLTLESIGDDGQSVASEQTALVAPVRGPEDATQTPIETVEAHTPALPAPPDAVTAPEPAETALAALDEGTLSAPAAPAAPPGRTEADDVPQAAPQVVIVAPDGAVPQSPAPAPARPNAPEVANVVIDTISYDQEGEVVLVGRAQPGNFVRLYLDNILAATETVAPDGTWRSRVAGIAAGIYTLRADETGAGGQVASRFETPFERVTRPRAIAAVERETSVELDAEGNPLRASAGLVTVQPGFTLWAIARENYGDGVQYVRVFEANRSQIRDPDLIYPGQIFAIPGQ